MDEKPSWHPNFPTGTTEQEKVELRKILFQAEIEIAKAKEVAKIEREKASHVSELEKSNAAQKSLLEVEKAIQDIEFDKVKNDRVRVNSQIETVFNAFVEVTKGEIDRSVTKANFIQGAAVAIAGLYTGLLAFTSVAKNKDLPIYGFLPTIFFGISIALTSAYISFITRPKSTWYQTTATASELPARDRDLFIRWMANRTLPRVQFLHAAVTSLCVGTVFLPIAFLEFQDLQNPTSYGLLGAVLVMTILLISWVINNRIIKQNSDEPTPVEQLLNHLQNSDPAVRNNAAISSASFNDSRLISVLVEIAVRDRDTQVRTSANNALRKIRESNSLIRRVTRLLFLSE